MNDPHISTYYDLYEFLYNHAKTNDSIIDWLNIPWIGKDKQESIFRLFSYLELIKKLDNYNICIGNFNLQTLTKINSYKDIFLDNKNNLIKLKDKGDSSDLSGFHKTNKNEVLATTSKNMTNKYSMDSLDIEKILANFAGFHESGYCLKICIAKPNKKYFTKLVKRMNKTNKVLIKLFKNNDNFIVIDHDDLNEAFLRFKNYYYYYRININDIFENEKKIIIFKLHQAYSIYKTNYLILNNDKNNYILWGHIQRSGKSYIIAGTIMEYSRLFTEKDESNYLIITTAPNETISQYINVFNCLQLKTFNIINLGGKNNNELKENKNIIICSKQYLQNKIHFELKKLNINIIFFDESHNGGTTDISLQIIDNYKNIHTTVINITATYAKPL